MKFQIKTKRLENLIKYVILKKSKGKHNLIENFIIKAEKGSLQVRKTDVTMVVFIEVIDKEVNIVSDGELPIGDVDEFMGFLNRMGKEVTIEYNGMQVTMDDGSKKAQFMPVAQDIEHLTQEVYKLSEDGSVETPAGLLKTSFEVNAAQIKSVVKDADQVGVNTFPLEVKDGRLEVSVGKPESSMITTKLNVSDFRGMSVKSEFSIGFDNVFSNVDGLVRVVMDDDSPLFLEKIDKNFTFRCIMAPVIENADYDSEE